MTEPNYREVLKCPECESNFFASYFQSQYEQLRSSFVLVQSQLAAWKRKANSLEFRLKRLVDAIDQEELEETTDAKD